MGQVQKHGGNQPTEEKRNHKITLKFNLLEHFPARKLVTTSFWYLIFNDVCKYISYMKTKMFSWPAPLDRVRRVIIKDKFCLTYMLEDFHITNLIVL